MISDNQCSTVLTRGEEVGGIFQPLFCVFFPPFFHIYSSQDKWYLYAAVVCGFVSNKVIVVTERPSTFYKHHNVVFLFETALAALRALHVCAYTGGKENELSGVNERCCRYFTW